ncbi:MAG: DUF1428 domain-containing protein [Paracoccus sp. (in: a-proteobacteria)]|nr:DUF1428 domain-containing protein [Paracoccus sp. (in: a-proteobacteria)]
MTCYTGMIAPVPLASRAAYLEHARAIWPLFRRYGARRMVDTWGVDTPPGKLTDYQRAVAAQADEAITFAWIEWPDRTTADAAWPAIEADPDMAAMASMPFDGSRVIMGGFAPLVSVGQTAGAGYYQGFLLAVPKANRAAYEKMAREAWGMFAGHGALGTVEAWGEDVPHGRKTDMYRATLAEPDEAILFSWIAWPDRATCDAAGRKMQAEMAGRDMPQMPFDGRRMIWGGFETLFDSGDN